MMVSERTTLLRALLCLGWECYAPSLTHCLPSALSAEAERCTGGDLVLVAKDVDRTWTLQVDVVEVCVLLVVPE